MPAEAIASQIGTSLARRRALGLRAAVMAAFCIAALSYLALARRDRTASPGEVGTSGLLSGTVLASSWQAAPATSSLYEIEPGQPAGSLRRESRVDSASGLREDTVLLGRFDDSRSHLALTLERGPLPSARLGLFVDLTRRAAPAGLAILRMGPLETVATKFGEVEAASVTLGGANERACLAFRWSDPEQNFAFKGWHCAADPAATRVEFACLIDRLGVTSVADRPLRSWFAQADARRNPACRLPAAALASRGATR